ncbi:hypothetical protein CSUB01_08187 [Colletotrichum sublineola]|uniref:CorA-like Mg2+ transporter n=1 Tax=Colletotrichum sublineola TaxID=1173701 RepID=A0A066XL40_COLSU|nr:hypothetical protein CSUB01_08187 [Colletotrichum sublineola]
MQQTRAAYAVDYSELEDAERDGSDQDGDGERFNREESENPNLQGMGTVKGTAEKHTSLGDGMDTELLIVNAAESFADEQGESMTPLYCAKDPLGQDVPSSNQVYWLPGNFRFDLEDTWDSVTFNSTPYLVFRERQEGQAAKDAMKTLLSTSIGYDMGGKNDEMQVLCETQKWLGKEILHVARFGSLIIGKEILLTWGEVSAPAIRKNNIIVNDTDSRPLVTKLHARVTKITAVEDFDIFEETIDACRVNADLWKILLEQASLELDDIRLNIRRKRPFGGSVPYPKQPGGPVSRRLWDPYDNSSVHYPRQPEGSVPRRPRSSYGEGPVRHHNLETVTAAKPRKAGSYYSNSEPFSGSDSSSKLSESRKLAAIVRYEEAPKSLARTLKETYPDKTINYQPLEENIANTYNISSSDDERKKQTHSIKMSRAASLRGSRSLRNRRSQIMKKNLDLESPITPFLMWRVTQGSGVRKEEEGRMNTMVRLMKKIDGSLKESGPYGRVHKDGYECSFESIRRRHETLHSPVPKPTVIEAFISGPKEDGNSVPIVETPKLRPLNLPTPASNDASVAEEPHGGLEDSISEEVNDLIGRLFEHSSAILNLFITLKDGDSGLYTSMRGVTDRFWGALDMMVRHLQFSALMNNAEDSQSWSVRASCYDHDGSATSEKCEACRSKAKYDLIGALEHLHAEHSHSQSSTHSIPARPFEDPCMVWLDTSGTKTRNATFMELIGDLARFDSDLKEILSLSRELHQFIASPGAKIDEPGAEKDQQTNCENKEARSAKRQTAAENDEKDQKPSSNRGTDSQTKMPVPAMPTSLLQAFKNILVFFSIQARTILLIVVDKKRIGRYRAEAKLTDQAVEKIQLEITEIRNLSLVGNKLRCQVREDLDVLDEGHGYAIRVFTLVTLIFLPLSFFTSFFGMNTTDIRDMPLGSSAYWATAVPATILILCSAYIYAYKSETLAQRVYRDGWVNRVMVKWSGGGLDQTVASREGFRPRSRFGRRGRSTSRSYEEWEHKDTWGMSRGDTMTAGAQV